MKKICLEFLLLPVQTLKFRSQYHDEGKLVLVIFLNKKVCSTFKMGNSMLTQFRKMWLMPFLYEAIRMYCGRVWNLNEACDAESSDCTSPPLIAPRFKNFIRKFFDRAGSRITDPLNQRQTYCRLNQRGGRFRNVNWKKLKLFFFQKNRLKYLS